MNIRTEKVISAGDWDKFVSETYGRPYCFQQQEGCRERGTFGFEVPDTYGDEDSEMNDSIPEVVNGERMGVKFAKWLERDPKAPLAVEEDCRTDKWAIDLWWARNFYPCFQTLANDLHKRGLLEAGKYTIDIDW